MNMNQTATPTAGPPWTSLYPRWLGRGTVYLTTRDAPGYRGHVRISALASGTTVVEVAIDDSKQLITLPLNACIIVWAANSADDAPAELK